jgi:NAD(P)-dependent dehydrogenase (short-subunit alcohol dehydrogenase family)
VALTVLVTGSSSGFGALIVQTLARAGYHVFASMRDTAGRNAQAAQHFSTWAQQEGVNLEVVELDVTSDESVQHAVGHILTAAGHIDVVVNNAAANAVGPLEAFSLAQIEALYNVNAFGLIRVCKAVLPSMRERRSGLIIFITSTVGRVLVGGGLYPASKWAAEGLAESFSHQVAPFGIDVAILEPGSFPTPIHGKATPAADTNITAAYDAVTPRRQRVPPGDGYVPPDPQQIADAVLGLIETPAGQRPLRSVVGPVFTEGVAEYNQAYDRTRAHLVEALRRPDQALTWSR